MDVNNRSLYARSILAGLGVGISLGTAVGIAMDSLAWGIGVGVALGLAMSILVQQVKAPMEIPAGARRKLVVAIIIYLVINSGAILLLDDEMARWLQILIAVIPALPAAFLAFTLGKMISQLDELQRKIQTESIAIGFAGTFVIAISYGLLGLVGVEQLNWIYVPIIMATCWLIGKLWTMWRYR